MPKQQKDKDLEEDEVDVFRHVGVGTEDPNIVGDAGSFDVPPGTDPHDENEFSDEIEEPLNPDPLDK